MITDTAALQPQELVPIERWSSSAELSRQLARILNVGCKRRKLFAFLREHCDKVFDGDLQRDLLRLQKDTGAGRQALYPAMMATALMLQGDFKVSDAEAVKRPHLESRSDMDRRLPEWMGIIARASKGFDSTKLS